MGRKGEPGMVKRGSGWISRVFMGTVERGFVVLRFLHCCPMGLVGAVIVDDLIVVAHHRCWRFHVPC